MTADKTELEVVKPNPKKKDKLCVDEDEDSGIVFFFTDNNTIHTILNLASSPVPPGRTPANRGYAC
uniref:Uncharacterized protein n=1 Tax=Amphimedon queenslandica TaxID=400682 RepID=A0A1X7UJU2_AMPQE